MNIRMREYTDNIIERVRKQMYFDRTTKAVVKLTLLAPTRKVANVWITLTFYDIKILKFLNIFNVSDIYVKEMSFIQLPPLIIFTLFPTSILVTRGGMLYPVSKLSRVMLVLKLDLHLICSCQRFTLFLVQVNYLCLPHTLTCSLHVWL